MIADTGFNLKSRLGVSRTDMDDPELIGSCLDGDQSAWEELISRYGRLIYSIPLRYGLSESDASDIFQSVCCTLLDKLGTLRDRGKLSSWLITTTTRECWRLKSRNRYFLPGDESATENEMDHAPLPDDVTVAMEQQNQVRNAMRRLPERCQKLIWYLFYDKSELPYTEIAAQLGIPLGSIGPTRARCLLKLRASLDESGFE